MFSIALTSFLVSAGWWARTCGRSLNQSGRQSKPIIRCILCVKWFPHDIQVLGWLGERAGSKKRQVSCYNGVLTHSHPHTFTCPTTLTCCTPSYAPHPHSLHSHTTLTEHASALRYHALRPSGRMEWAPVFISLNTFSTLSWTVNLSISQWRTSPIYTR